LWVIVISMRGEGATGVASGAALRATRATGVAAAIDGSGARRSGSVMWNATATLGNG